MKQIPPSSIEAEKTIISSMMVYPESIPAIRAYLEPKHFYLERHRKIFQVITELHNAGDEIDPVVVYEKAKDAGVIQVDGSFAKFQAELVGEHYIVASHAHMARVKHDYLVRKLLGAIGDASKLGYQDRDFDSMTDILRMVLNELSDEVDSRSFDVSSEFGSILTDEGSVVVPWYIDKLDLITGGCARKELTVVGARPGHGKTTFMVDRATTWAQAGHKVCIFSLEMSKKVVKQMILANLAGVKRTKLRLNTMDDDDKRLIREAVNVASQWAGRFWLFDDVYTMSGVRKTLSAISPDIVIFDWIQMMSLKTANAKDELDRNLAEFKRIAKENDCCMILVSMANRDTKNNPGGRPLLDNLSLSDGLGQFASDAILIHWEYYVSKAESIKNITELIVPKSRYGTTGTIYLSFDPTIGRFESPSRAEEDRYEAIINGDMYKFGVAG